MTSRRANRPRTAFTLVEVRVQGVTSPMIVARSISGGNSVAKPFHRSLDECCREVRFVLDREDARSDRDVHVPHAWNSANRRVDLLSTRGAVHPRNAVAGLCR